MSKAEEYAALLREMHEAKAASINGSNHRAYFATVDAVEAWEDQNRDLIARTLRLLEVVENPDSTFLEHMDSAFYTERAKGGTMGRCSLGVLAALREAIR